MRNQVITPFQSGQQRAALIQFGSHAKKSPLKGWLTSFLTTCALLGGAASGYSQITVQVDSTKPWEGYMNVYDYDGVGQGGYLWGSGWGLAALQASINTSQVTLQPCVNVWNTNDPYWVNTNTIPFAGAKWMEANFFVNVVSGFGGQDVTFTGEVLTNSLVSPYTAVAVVKEFRSGYAFVGMTTEPLIEGLPFTVSRTIGEGNIAQYGFIVTGPDADPVTVASLGLVAVKVNNSDPSITGQPENRRIQVGDSASFTVAAVGGSTLHYVWKRDGTNLIDGGNIAGAATATLTITNSQLSDSTTYTVTVSDNNGSLDASATLLVKTPAEYVNFLENPGFETGLDSPWWFRFPAVTTGSLRTTNDNYAFTPENPVSVLAGDYVSYTEPGGEWSGVYQDVAAVPGQIFRGEAWFLTPTLEAISGGATAFLEVQFRGGGTVLQQYQSALVDENTPKDVWFSLAATNGVPAGYAVLSSSNSQYLVAPAGTTLARFQISMHSVGGAGSIYYDTLSLMLKTPVTLAASASGGNITLSWESLAATSYDVVYKTDLSDATWTWLETVAGTGSALSRTYATAGGKRFYAVLTK